MRTSRIITITEALRPVLDGGRSEQALLRLTTWLSPGFPTGAFAYSHGLEAAIADGWVGAAASVEAWIEALLASGSGWNDLVLFAQAHRAVMAADFARLADTAELATALAGSAERRAETLGIGHAFRRAVEPWVYGGGDRWPHEIPYPVAVGASAASCGIALAPALTAFASAFAQGLVSAATRLVPLGQGDAVAILARLEPAVLHAAEAAERSSVDDLGSAALASDIAAMRHETLRTRLFRS